MATTPRVTRKGWDALEDPVPGDVIACLTELGVEMIRVIDDEVMGHCPAHVRRTGKQDRHPSWSVNLITGQHNCFSCGFRGPFYLITKEVAGLNDDEAIKWVKARGSIDRVRRIIRGGTELEPVEFETYTEADLALYVEVPDYACSQRDLAPYAVDAYGIVWDDAKTRWITPIREPFTDSLLGWQEKGHHDRYFRNRPTNVKKGQTLFGLNELQGTTAVLVESPLDVPKIYGATDEKIGVSSFGARVTDDQIRLLVEAGVKTLICALDNDRDGIAASDEMRNRIRATPMRLKYWDYSQTKAKDPGDQTDYEICQSYENAYSSILWKK